MFSFLLPWAGRVRRSLPGPWLVSLWLGVWALTFVLPAAAKDLEGGPVDEFRDDLTARIQLVSLENGLRIYVLERDFSPTFAGYYQFQVGGAHDPDGRTGIAHLLEHMMFKGTTTVGTTNLRREQAIMAELAGLWDELQALLEARDEVVEAGDDRVTHLRSRIRDLVQEQKRYIVKNEYDEIMTRNGGRSMNASTGNDRTNYFLQLPSNMLELWFLMESDRLTKPVFREFYTERDVVAEERRMRVDNRPEGLIYEAMNRMLYPAHPYGSPVIGWEDDLERLRRADAEEYFRTYYSPGNCVMVLVGDVDVDEVGRLAKKYLAGWERQDVPSLEVAEDPPPSEERRQSIEFDAQPRVLLGWRTVPEGHEDQYPLDLLARILGGMSSSRLEQQLVQSDRLASRVRASSSTERYGGDFTIAASPGGEHSNDELEAAILAVVEEVRSGGVTVEELERARIGAEVRRVRRLESNLRLAFQIGATAGATGGVEYLDEYAELLDAVTVEDVQEVAKRYLGRSQLNVAQVVQVEGAAKPARGSGDGRGGGGGHGDGDHGRGGDDYGRGSGDSRGGGVNGRGDGDDGSSSDDRGQGSGGAPGPRGERHSMGFARAMNLASFAPPIVVDVPEIGEDVERVVLPSGITVFLVETREVPAIRMQMTWLGGSNRADVEALAPFELAAQLLRDGGTAELTPAEVEVRLDELGMNFDFSMGGTESRADFWSLSRNFEDSFALATDLLRRPRLDEGRLRVLEGQYIQAMRTRPDNPGRAVSVVRDHVLHGAHPRLGRVITREEIEALTPPDIEKVIGTYLGADNLFLTVVGDFDREAMLETIEARIGSWGGARDPEREWIVRPPAKKPGVFLVEKDLPQPAIRITQELSVDRTASERTHAALEIANDIFGGSGFRSRLMERLRSDEGLTYSVRSTLSHEGRPGTPGRLEVSYQTKQESVARSIGIVLEEMEKMKYGAVSDEEFEEQIQAWRNSFVFRYDNEFRSVVQLMEAELDDRAYDFEKTRLATVGSLRVGEVMAAAKEYFDPAAVTITIFGTLTAEDEERLGERFTVTRLSREDVFSGGYEREPDAGGSRP